jgi:UDP-N-acetylmuramate--alanine ligase
MTGRFRAPEGSIPTLDVPPLDGLRRVHLIGIGGAGMSGIARLLLARGIGVAGSDLKASRGLEDLRSAGARVAVGHDPANVTIGGGSPDAVVISSAIPERNPELVEARRLGVPILRRAQVLAALAGGRRCVAVSGTHGKTTTTSMLSVILERAGADPSYVIGGDLNEIGSGARHGDGEWFVAEADESDGSFLLLRPDVAVITNVEDDHLDFYGDRAGVVAAFADFAAGAGTVIACADDEGTREALAASGRAADAVTYGTGPDNRAVVSAVGGDAVSVRGSVRLPDGATLSLRIPVPGAHNLLDAAAAVLAAAAAGVAPQVAADALGSFVGVRRRFERRGRARGAEFVDDYAHHPTEIAATLAAAGPRAGRVIAVFQPHRYTRTQALWRELGASLVPADLAVVTEVYGAGEEPIPGVNGKLVVDALAEAAPGKRIVYLPRRSEVVGFLSREVREGDLVLTLGAGDVTMVGAETLERIEEDA